MYRNISLWIAVFFINYAFQLYRGDPKDKIIFGVVLAMIIAETVDLLNWIPEFKRVRKITAFVIPVFAFYLLFTKRQSTSGYISFLLFSMLMFFAIWRKSNGDTRSLSHKEIRNARILGVLIGFLCFWEISMFSLERIFHSDYLYPTISVLLVPHLDSLLGRGVFLVIWVMLGFFLLNDWDES